MESILEDLNRKFVSRTPHMREIGAHITSVSASRGSMTLPARPEYSLYRFIRFMPHKVLS